MAHKNHLASTGTGEVRTQGVHQIFTVQVMVPRCAKVFTSCHRQNDPNEEESSEIATTA